MTELASLLATIALTTLALWTLGSRVLRILGSLLILAALVRLALGEWPFASALMLVPGLTAWLTGHLLYTYRHHHYASPLAERPAHLARRGDGAFGAPRPNEHLGQGPLFIEKVRDVVGLYLAPPERAVVLCVDEKSQIQALDRTAPILPMLPGTPERATHDYKRAGTSSLYAALDITTGKVIGALHQRHRAIEFKKFLRAIDREVPDDLAVRLVLDNSSTHKTPAIQRWLAAHPRFVLHFTPTSSSWLNLVERWFAALTTKKLRRGAHRSVAALNADIRAWIETWNTDPKPFVWTTTADQILDSIAHYRQRINDSRHTSACAVKWTIAVARGEATAP
jgi:transposase